MPHLKFRLSKCEWYVSVSDHVLKERNDVRMLDHIIFPSGTNLDLSLHGDAEEGDEVHHEDRPENRDVEELEEGTHKGN